MIKNHHGVWVFDPYWALVGETSINNLDCQVFAVARVNGNMLSLFSQSMLGSGQSCGMFIPRGDWNQPAANRCQFPHQCFVCCSPNDAPPTFVTSNKPTPARSHPKVPLSDGLSFQLKQTLNIIVGSCSKLECTVFIDTMQYEYIKSSYTCYKRYSTVSNHPPVLPDPTGPGAGGRAESEERVTGSHHFLRWFQCPCGSSSKWNWWKNIFLFAMDLYIYIHWFYVCCLNPSEYICNNHLFKIYIYTDFKGAWFWWI